MAAAMVISMVATSATYAGVVSFPASQDNTLYEDSAGTLSNARGEGLFAGRTMIDTVRRGVIAFDVSVIPAGSTVTSVTLTLACTRSVSLAEATTLHRALANWGEGTSIALGEGGNGSAATDGDATWIHRYYSTQTWMTPGGDFSVTPSATTDVSGIGFYSWTSAGLVSDVQDWLGDPSANFGWFILGNESVSQSAKRFASREHQDALLRPTLTVEYTPIPGVGMLPALGCAACASVRRRRV
jgi:hypothetical protein